MTHTDDGEKPDRVNFRACEKARADLEAAGSLLAVPMSLGSLPGLSPGPLLNANLAKDLIEADKAEKKACEPGASPKP